MKKNNNQPILFTTWDAERAQAELELHEIEKERALEDVVRLIKRFELRAGEIMAVMGPAWAKPACQEITAFEPYFGGR